MLPFHDHRHCTNVSFTAMFGLNMFQHCLSGQRASVANTSVKVLDPLDVCAGKAGKGRASVISTDAVHNRRVKNLFWCSM
jgi:hypothetical protein